MAAVQFNCPHCQGTFQVDDSLSGLQVSCPHCQRVATLPDRMPAGGASMGAPGGVPHAAGRSGDMPHGAMTQYNCPRCQGMFQVDSSLAGQQVSCPHCRTVVSLPNFAPGRTPTSHPAPTPVPSPSLPPQPAPAPVAPSKSAASPSPSIGTSLYPPGFGPKDTSPGPKTPPSTPATKSSSPSTGASMYPPGFGPAASPAPTSSPPVEPKQSPPAEPVKAVVPTSAPPPPASPERYPPGYSPPTDAAVTPSPATLAMPAGPVVHGPYPTHDTQRGTPVASGPPTAAVPLSPVTPVSPWPAAGMPRLDSPPASRRSSVDELLPPGVASSPATEAKGTPVAPASSDGRSPSGPNAPILVAAASAPKLPEGVVMLPTADGGFVGVDESTKRVKFEGEEVEVRRLTSEEKQHRRFIKNIIMAVLGILFLAVVALVLMLTM